MTTGWTWARARARGTSHVRTNTRCQDAQCCLTTAPDGTAFIAVVADGAGSASHGGAGSALTARRLSQALATHARVHDGLPSDDDVWGWVDDLRDEIGTAAAARGLTPRDFATTLVAGLARNDELLLMLVGDGLAAIRSGGRWSVPSWPEHGEYASTTFFLTDDPAPQVRIVRSSNSFDALALMTDGIERIALDFTAKQPHHPFFSGIIAPVDRSEVKGHDAVLSRSLHAFLDGDGVNARTDDDKTLVLAVRK